MANWPYNTAQWKRLRTVALMAQPRCVHCWQIGRLTPATTVDHKVPVRLGGAAFPHLDGLDCLCGPCHAHKTARGPEAGAVRTSKPRKGCDVNGVPLDPAHPWNAEKSLGAEPQRHAPNPTFDLVRSKRRGT